MVIATQSLHAIMFYLPPCFYPDINECLSTATHNCSAQNNEICVNIEGSFQCNCTEGFSKETDNNTCQGMYIILYETMIILYPVCIDINECIWNAHTCSYNEDCVNEIGNFSCLCKNGFELQSNGSCGGK